MSVNLGGGSFEKTTYSKSRSEFAAFIRSKFEGVSRTIENGLDLYYAGNEHVATYNIDKSVGYYETRDFNEVVSSASQEIYDLIDERNIDDAGYDFIAERVADVASQAATAAESSELIADYFNTEPSLFQPILAKITETVVAKDTDGSVKARITDPVKAIDNVSRWIVGAKGRTLMNEYNGSDEVELLELFQQRYPEKFSQFLDEEWEEVFPGAYEEITQAAFDALKLRD
jgi:hypothetical protein